MTGASSTGPKFVPQRHNPLEYDGGRSLFPTATRVTRLVPIKQVQCFHCGEKGHYANNCPNPRKQGGGVYDRLCQNCHTPWHTAPQCPKPMISRPKVQFVEVPSTSGPKTTPDMNVQTIGWEMAPTIAKEQPGSETRPSDPMPTSSPCYISDEKSGLEGWPSDSEWMVN
ncbi:hypothetical protein R1flu_026962 [Riccia fluitans]|uniref:CCHC-type domain-containing protein n=1 Tax=Riccia fluitans TaxID=41844 RepID=A0ABD1XHG0_9MARC